MRKKRTSRSIWSHIRRTAAVFVCAAALWLIWLTTDPSAVFNHLRQLAADPSTARTLLGIELGRSEPLHLSALDRLILSQSPLLSTVTPAETLTPPPSVNAPQPEDNDETETAPLPVTTTAPEGIIGKTMVAGSSSKYVTSGNISIYNHTGYTLDIGALADAAPTFVRGSDGPLVLIYHSHATEAYTMDGTDIYEESDSYRTLDTSQNVVRVGTEIAWILESAGIEVIHDTTLYDYPSYNQAYARSSEGVAQWLEQYPSIRLVIDVHRDALIADDGTLYKTVTGTVDNCAQVMMVIGSDAGGQKHPNWRVNLALAVRIQQSLTDKWLTFARPIVLRTSRFNQQLSTGSILLEVGSHGNTLQEAITAGRLFARTLVEMIK